MATPSAGTLPMLLHAASRVLGCTSAQIALVDGERLVLRLGMTSAEVPTLKNVESVLGFQAEGASLPLATEGSNLVRTVREGRLLVTARIAQLVGSAVPEEVCEQIQAVIGPNTFATVPVLGRSGPVGVILFGKEGDAGFAPADRDLLVAYADRVGAALESEGIADGREGTAEVGTADGASGELPPSRVLVVNAQLVLVDGEQAGTELPVALRASRKREALLEAARSATAGVPHAIALTDDEGRALRVTLRPVPGGLFAVVVEEVGWLERLGREAARAREHLARLVGSVGDGVLTVDGHGMIVGGNAAVQKLVEAEPGWLLGRPVDELLADERTRRRAAQMSARLLADGHAEAELRVKGRGGRVHEVRVSSLLLADDEGRPAGALWRVQDLSARRRGEAERKRLRAELLRSQRLSALGEMAARIAHEVRNPLVSIGAAARVVEEELATGTPAAASIETAVGEAQAIQREVRRLDGIVVGFLHFARHQRPAEAPRQVADLGRLLDETITLVRARAPSLSFAVEGPGPAGCALRCDPDGVRQVLWNVLANAAEASPPGATVRCRLAVDAGRAELTVADEGPGLSSLARRRAFDPFFSTKSRGTGLGLAISREIVEAHDGRIRIDSPRKGGTRVRIELPLG